MLFVPPLRERQEDIALLANHFAARMAFELDRREIPQFSEAAMQALAGHSWPGNVRELKNVVERAVYRSDSALITEINFHPFQSPFGSAALPGTDRQPQEPEPAQPQSGTTNRPSTLFSEAVRDLEIQLLERALSAAKYNQRQAAKTLGLTYHQFRGLYRKYSEVIASGDA